MNKDKKKAPAKSPEPEAAAAAVAKTGVAALDDLFQSLNRCDAPGLVVGVAQKGKTLYRRGFGMASLEHAVANTPATRMRIGSVTKHFTCLAILLLAEEGKLDADAPVTTYLPELPVLKGAPTLRQLMNHTSGYRCYVDIETTAGGMTTQPVGKAFVAQVQQTDANFAPGEAQLYCNGSFHLLSIVVDRVSGMPFEQFLQERIFAPLGMIDTTCAVSDLELHSGMATLHVPRPNANGGISWRRGIFITDEMRGEGNIISTVDDMLVWLEHLRSPEKRVGTAETWAQMTTTATLNNGLRTPYALGLFRHDYRGLETIYHHGAVYGGFCQMLTVPAHGLDIIIITNGGMVNHIELSKRIIDSLLPEHVQGDAAAKMADFKGYEHLAGTHYIGEDGITFGFDDVGGKLGASMLFSPPAPIWRDEGTQIRIAFEDAAMGPFVFQVKDLAADATGKAPAVIPISVCGNVSRLKRLPAKAPSTAKAGQALVGRYRSEDLDAEARIAFEGDALILRTLSSYGTRQMRLEAASSMVFRLSVVDPLLPSSSALVLERQGEAISGFFFSSTRARQLRFKRIQD